MQRRTLELRAVGGVFVIAAITKFIFVRQESIKNDVFFVRLNVSASF